MSKKSKHRHEQAEDLEDLNEETTEEETSEPNGERRGRAIAFARRHPALTVAGAATVGLFGGLELAMGVLLGAGVAALIRGRRAPTENVRERARSMVDRVSPEVRKRARAVFQAARGKIEPATT